MSRYAAENDWLPAGDAREKLFDEILEQLAACDLFSNTALWEPTIFPVYAHNNVAIGDAHDTCVHHLISWLQRIKAGILSDKSALPPLISNLEDTSAQRNIIANQIRLLPPVGNGRSDETITYIDRVIVCGSEVLEKYCRTAYASKYIDEVVNICKSHESLPMEKLKSVIEAFVHGETEKEDFHHVLTEIAFLEVRKSRRPDRHGMVPVALDGAHHLPYLKVIAQSDITFKLKSTSTAAKHGLFFQLLEQLFVEHKDLVNDFRSCYKRVVDDLRLGSDERSDVRQETFRNYLTSNITKTYRNHWSTFSTAVRNGKFNDTAGILGRHVLDFMERNIAKERREILQWVSPMAAPPMPGKYQDGRAKRLDGTCDWVINDKKFTRWYESRTSAIMSLQGRMGMGKTHATSRVIEWIQGSQGERKHPKALAYFYCIEQDEMRSTVTAILRSIVRQIAIGPIERAPLNQIIVDMWEIHGQDGQAYDTSTFDEWEKCLAKLIDNYHGAMIVLDALDECKSAGRADLTKLFTFLTDRCSNLKIFVSTRPEPDLSRWLEEHPSISMDNERTSGDIEAFVRDKIAQHTEWPHRNNELKELVLKTIVEKSQGLFLCAHLQIENLQECMYEEDIRDALTTLPQKLTELYEKLYLRASIKPAEKKFRDRALRWVLSSSKPLTSSELLYAISQDSQSDRLAPIRQELTERLILKSCHNFLTLDSSNTNYGRPTGRKDNSPASVWRLAHQAVAEFYETSVSCAEERAEMHYEAGKVCLMISLDVFGGSAVEYKQRYENGCPCQIGTHSKQHFMFQEPLVEYAINAWPTHVRAHEHQDSHNDRLSQMLLRFLNGPREGSLIYDRWLEHAGRVASDLPWSAVYQRELYTITRRNNLKMSPISLVCYLGFPQTLFELLQRPGIEKATMYNAGSWLPWSRGLDYSFHYVHSLWWSTVALACVHDEVKVLHCLLNSEHPARLDTFAADEVPPIVAAVIRDSVEVARELLRPRHGLSMCSSFTDQYGHVLRFALRGNSLRVLPLLLDRLLDSPTSGGVLSSIQRSDFRSREAFSLLLEKVVEVNTPLAASWGEGPFVDNLLSKSADVSGREQIWWIRKGQRWQVQNVLEIYLCDRRQNPRISIVHGLVESGATVGARAVAIVADEIRCEYPGRNREELLYLLTLLLAKISEPDEIRKDQHGVSTCALKQALLVGSVAGVKSLLDRGADPNLSLEVEGATSKVLAAMFQETLSRTMDDPYPIRQMVELLEKAGANFVDWESSELNMALAAAAQTGLTNLVRVLLECGADPNAPYFYHFITPLGAAAASAQPEAPDIIRMLLDKVDVNLHLPAQFNAYRGKFALDFPLWIMLHREASARFHEPSHVECLRNWARSASILASNGAIWDVDFAQWRKCLREVEPRFESDESKTLDKIKEDLDRNRSNLSASQKASDKWKIKDPLAPEFGLAPVREWRAMKRCSLAPRFGPRIVLASMREVLLGEK